MRKHPFTLLELVAAMGIMLLVAGIVGTASTTFYNGYIRSLSSAEKLKSYQKIDRIMDSCVRNTIAFPWNDENDTQQILFNGRTDTLQFACLRRSYTGDQGAFLFIRLRVDEENRLVADYSPYPRFHWETNQEYTWTTEVIAEKVREISFLYANQSADDEDTIDWVEEWREYSSDGQQADDDFLDIPLAIQLKVIFQDGTEEVWLRRTLGNSKNTTML